jgi:hypothetical protein
MMDFDGTIIVDGIKYPRYLTQPEMCRLGRFSMHTLYRRRPMLVRMGLKLYQPFGRRTRWKADTMSFLKIIKTETNRFTPAL